MYILIDLKECDGMDMKERNWRWLQGLGPEQSEDELIIWEGDYV